MAKRAGRVGFGSGQSGLRVKRVTGQNGSFLNGLTGLRVNRVSGRVGSGRVDPYFSNFFFFFFFFNYKKTNIKLKRLRKKSNSH